jgi:hypothetical protein
MAAMIVARPGPRQPRSWSGRAPIARKHEGPVVVTEAEARNASPVTHLAQGSYTLSRRFEG